MVTFPQESQDAQEITGNRREAATDAKKCFKYKRNAKDPEKHSDDFILKNTLGGRL